jgi:hypothetical protein
MLGSVISILTSYQADGPRSHNMDTHEFIKHVMYLLEYMDMYMEPIRILYIPGLGTDVFVMPEYSEKTPKFFWCSDDDDDDDVVNPILGFRSRLGELKPIQYATRVDYRTLTDTQDSIREQLDSVVRDTYVNYR